MNFTQFRHLTLSADAAAFSNSIVFLPNSQLETTKVTTRLSAIFQFDRTVQEAEIDELQHVNNLVYLKWAMDAAVAHSTHVGWSPERYRELGSGFIVRSHSIKYKRSAKLGDGITTKTWIYTMERVSSIRKYEIRRKLDNKLLATAETNWVFVDLATQALRSIPTELVEDFAQIN